MARYRDITPAEMTPPQRRVHDLIIAGRRGRFGGPFQLLIRAPEICEHAAKLGEHLRWGTSLPDRLSELAIITTAKFWRAQDEWYAHAPLAEKAGGPSDAGEAAGEGRRIRELLALDDPCLIQKEPSEFRKLVRRTGLADCGSEPLDQLVPRVELQNALGGGIELPVLLQQPLEMHVHVALIG